MPRVVPSPFVRSLAALLTLPVLLTLSACAKNPATGQRQLTLVSEAQEIEMGQQGAKEIDATMPRLKDERVQAYVSAIGMRMAKQSERPHLPWKFTVLDDPMVNAFALPGGPIYINRGIIENARNEGEVAGVLPVQRIGEIDVVGGIEGEHAVAEEQFLALRLGQ